jgi:hypothetical protein
VASKRGRERSVDPRRRNLVAWRREELEANPALGEHINRADPAVAPSGLLAHTGTDHLMSLVGLALSLLAAGLALMAGLRRRIRSASSAG